MPKVRWVVGVQNMGFVGNFMRFPAVQNF